MNNTLIIGTVAAVGLAGGAYWFYQTPTGRKLMGRNPKNSENPTKKANSTNNTSSSNNNNGGSNYFENTSNNQNNSTSLFTTPKGIRINNIQRVLGLQQTG